MLRVAMVLMLAGCGAAAAPRRLPSNTVLAPMGELMAAPRAPLLLWCSVAGGEQYVRAQMGLGVRATNARDLPAELFEGEAWRDLEDDCADPELQALRRDLGEALHVPADGWVDQIGQLTLERIDVPVHGGGCTNATLPGVPDVKIQFGATGRGTIAVVRVWELP